MKKGRPSPPRNGTALTAQGDRLALDSQFIQNPLDYAAKVLPVSGSPLPSGETDATAILQAVAFFIPKLDQLTHADNSLNNLETRNSENDGELIACPKKSLARMQTA